MLFSLARTSNVLPLSLRDSRFTLNPPKIVYHQAETAHEREIYLHQSVSKLTRGGVCLLLTEKVAAKPTDEEITKCSGGIAVLKSTK